MAELLVRLVPDDLDGGWTAWVDEKPGCASQGDTQPDALRNLADALEGVLAVEADDRRG